MKATFGWHLRPSLSLSRFRFSPVKHTHTHINVVFILLADIYANCILYAIWLNFVGLLLYWVNAVCVSLEYQHRVHIKPNEKKSDN